MAKAVRLQVSLSTSYVDALAAMAEKVGWSQSGLAAELLSVAVAEQESFHKWLAASVGRLLLGTNKRKSVAVEHACLQVMVAPELAERIARFAEGQYRRPGEMAGVLLRYAIEDAERVTEVVNTRFAKAVLPLAEKLCGPILKRERKGTNGTAR